MKIILSVQPAQSIVSSYLYAMNGDDVPRDLLTVVTQEVIGEGLGFEGCNRGEATAIGGRDNHGLDTRIAPSQCCHSRAVYMYFIRGVAPIITLSHRSTFRHEVHAISSS